MEDTYFFDSNFYPEPVERVGKKGVIFAGVYDGHGGKEVAEYAAKNLHRRFKETLKISHLPKAAFEIAYQQIDSEVRDFPGGATATTIYLENKKLYWANTGDSRLVLVSPVRDYQNKEKRQREQISNGVKNDDIFEQLSQDHRLEDPEERERIKKSGGVILDPYIYKGMAGIMLTRSLGDHFFRNVGVIPDPVIDSRIITAQDKFLILATDGLWDIAENEEVVGRIKNSKDANEAVQELKKLAIEERKTNDNITIIAVKF